MPFAALSQLQCASQADQSHRNSASLGCAEKTCNNGALGEAAAGALCPSPVPTFIPRAEGAPNPKLGAAVDVAAAGDEDAPNPDKDVSNPPVAGVLGDPNAGGDAPNPPPGAGDCLR